MQYPDHTRSRARELFLAGKSLVEIASDVGVSDADTIGRWRDEEGWPQLKQLLEAQVRARLEAKASETDEKVRARQEVLVGAIEGLIGRFLRTHSESGIDASELKALAGCLLHLQSFRQKSGRKDEEETRVIVIR